MTAPTTAPGLRPRRTAEATGLAGYNFLAMVRRGFFYTFLLVYLRERLGQPVTFIALIGATNATASILGQNLLWGRLSDRMDRRAGLMVRGEAIAGFGYLVTFAVYRLTLGRVAPGVTTLIVIGCLGTVEFFWSMTDVGFRAAIAQVTSRENRGRFLGLIDFTGLIGTGAGLALAGVLYDGGAGIENGPLWFLAAAFILAGVPLIRITLSHLDGVRDLATPPPAAGPLAPDFRRYMGALAIAVLGIWSFLQIHSFFVRLPDTAAADDAGLSLVRACFWAAGGLLAPLAGRWIDRVGSRRAYVWSLLACSLLPAAFLPTASVAYAAASLAVFGAAFTALRASSYAYAAELAPDESRGRHFAVYNAVMSLGWGIAAVVVGGPVADLVIAAGGSARAGYSASFLAGGALGLAGLAGFLVVARARQASTPSSMRSTG